MAITLYYKPSISISRTPFPSCSFPCTTPNIFPRFGSKFSRIRNPKVFIPTRVLSSRRQLLLPSVSALWDALTSGSNSAREAVSAVRRGMLLFRQGDVAGSLVEFDKAIELDPRQKAYLWQRGLSLYYVDRFEEGAEQFRLDVSQNPNDTEETLWCFLCEAQLYGVDEARRRFLEDGRDRRPVMREAYGMYKDGGDPEKLVAAFSAGRDNEYFYASLYAGLYYESQNQTNEAKRHIVAACQSPYSGLTTTWLLLPRCTASVETGARLELRRYSRIKLVPFIIKSMFHA